MKLYGSLRSRASRPWWALTEAGIGFELVPVIQGYRLPDPLAADAPLNTAAPAYLAINPQGQIPALVDGDLVLTESLAIAVHAARRGGTDFGPQTPAEEAEVMQWVLVAATGIESGALEILYTYGAGAQDSEAGQARIAAGIAAIARACARTEAHLRGRDWLVGGRFTVADLCVAECLRYAQAHPPALEPYPGLRAWLARCQDRPAFRAMLEQRAAEPA